MYLQYLKPASLSSKTKLYFVPPTCKWYCFVILVYIYIKCNSDIYYIINTIKISNSFETF